MSMVPVSISLESDSVLNQIGESEVKDWLARRGIACMSTAEAESYVNIEKSIGTMPFYNLLTDAIESGKMSLEMLVGHVATRKIMKSVNVR